MNENTQAIDSIGVIAGKTAVVTGGGTALYSFMSQEFLFGFIGLLIAAITMGINWYYKKKEASSTLALHIQEMNLRVRAAQRAEEEHNLKMDLMRLQVNQEGECV